MLINIVFVLQHAVHQLVGRHVRARRGAAVVELVGAARGRHRRRLGRAAPTGTYTRTNQSITDIVFPKTSKEVDFVIRNMRLPVSFYGPLIAIELQLFSLEGFNFAQELLIV